MGYDYTVINEGLDAFAHMKLWSDVDIVGEFIFIKTLPKPVAGMQIGGRKTETVFFQDSHGGIGRRNKKGNTVVFIIFKMKSSIFVN